MPSSLKLRHGTGNHLEESAARRPPSVFCSGRSKGFSIPLAEWFRGELKGFTQDVMFQGQDDLLNRQFLSRCWNQHQRRQRLVGAALVRPDVPDVAGGLENRHERHLRGVAET